jgi:hypothetical protein
MSCLRMLWLLTMLAIVSLDSMAAAHERANAPAFAMSLVGQVGGGEALMLAIGNAVISGGILYLIFRLIVGLGFLKARHKPHSLLGLAWVMGAHFFSFGLMRGNEIMVCAVCFLFLGPVAMVFIYHKLDQANQSERKPSVDGEG